MSTLPPSVNPIGTEADLAPDGRLLLDLPGYDPFGPDGANINVLIGNDHIDPISGSVPHRSYLCEVRRPNGREPMTSAGD